MIKGHLPDKMKIKGVTFVRSLTYSALSPLEDVKSFCKKHKLKYRTLKVLSPKLRGVNNVHGKPYTPNTFYMIEEVKEKIRSQQIEIINKGADVSNFGDPVKWQKETRKERM